MSFTNKVILITGAGSGIGADAAISLAKKGASIALIDRDQDSLNQVFTQITNNSSPLPFAIQADITTDAERIINKTIEHFGKLDVLINCAGVFMRSNIVNIDMADFDRIMNTNFRSMVLLTKLAVPHLEKTHGNILNVSSIAGIRMRPNSFVYGISKAAVNHLTKSCALDLASKGIRVNAINPGNVRTKIYERGGLTSEEVTNLFETLEKKYPAGRTTSLTDTTSAIEFLISDAASGFTGVLLPVDGGALLAGL